MRGHDNINKYCDKGTVLADKCLNSIFLSETEKRSYIVLETLAVVMIFLLCRIVYIVSYKTTLKNPLENMQETFFKAQLIAILICLVMTACGIIFLKTREKVILILKIVVVVNMIGILGFIWIKLNWDTLYTEQWFSKYFDENENSEMEKKYLSFNQLEIEIISEKEKFVNDNIIAYKYFGVKSFFCTIIYIIIELFEVYLMIRISKLQKRQIQLQKDDLVVYDKEKNIKR